MYLTAHNVEDMTCKRVLLLYSTGEEFSDIFETLPDQGEQNEYEKAVVALNACFQPKVNKTYKIYIFRNATQNSGESLDSYCTRLRHLAQTCKFTNEDEENNQVTHSRVLFTLTFTSKSSSRRHESQSSTQLWPGSRNVQKASQRYRGI